MTATSTKTNLLAGLGLAVILASLWLAPATQAAEVEAWTVYKKFVAECQTATSFEPLLPLLPDWRRKRVEAADEASRKETLDRICKDAKDLQDIAFISADEAKAKTVLHLKASWNDSPMKGRVVVVREKDGLKVDEWFWATGQ